MQGLLAAAAPAAAAPLPFATLSSSNLARHTSSNPPAPRKTVQHYLATVEPIHASNAYELGPPPQGEFDHVKTPPRAVEAKRKRRLQDWDDDRGESWIRRPEIRARLTGSDRAADGEALVLIRADSPQSHRDRDRTHAPRPSGELSQRPRKPLVVTAMKGRSSTPASRGAKNKQATGAISAPLSRSPSRDDADAGSDKSSFILPRAIQLVDTSKGPRDRKGKRTEKDNKAMKRKEGKPGRREAERPTEAAEQAELDDLEEREWMSSIRRDVCCKSADTENRPYAGLRGRRERRRQNALIRKDRSLPAAAVGVAAAARVKKAAKQTKRARAESDADSDASSSASDEQAGRKPAKRASKEDRSRERVGKLDRPSNVGAHRLTVSSLATLRIAHVTVPLTLTTKSPNR